MRQITRDSIECSSIRILARRYNLSKQSVMEAIHTVTQEAKDSIWIAENYHPAWSGILVFDGKYIRAYDKLATKLDPDSFSEQEIKHMHKKVWLCGIDSGTGDLPHYDLADEETKVDLVLSFKTLKSMDYGLKVLVCDGNDHIVSAARKVYGNTFLVQRCTRHFIEGLKRKAKEKGIDEHPQTEELITLIQYIIMARDIEEANKHLQELKQKPFKHKHHRYLIDLFKERAEGLTTHLMYPELKIPHTTNEIENVFRQANLRLKSLGRFGHWRYARDYLKTWALWRRFTPYTDCCKKRRHRNGKAPLQLAGCNIVDKDFLSR